MAAGCQRCGAPLPGAAGTAAVCPACQVTAGGPGPAPADEQLAPAAWAWADPAAARALRTRQLGPILRAYRRAAGLTQEQLATRLGYDKTYVSMIETGRRAVHDVPARRHIARTLAIPPHLLGVTDPRDSEHVAMVSFAQAVIRLADLARRAGRAAEAVNELWPLVARLEARAAEGHLEADTLGVLGQAWISLGISLGTILPEERLTVATQWTAKGVAAAEQLDDPAALAEALAMHGNELRKNGQPGTLASLERAVATVGTGPGRGAALALLARASATVGDAARFTSAITSCQDLIQRHGPAGPLLHPFTLREIQLRGLLDLGDPARAVTLAQTTPAAAAPAPQWEVIEQITSASVLLSAGDRGQAEALLHASIDTAGNRRLPHQIQRVIRITRKHGHQDLHHHARSTLAQACSRPVLDSAPSS
ncbi:MAG TPA: helix-turn-helix domain-containing protein [Streptosporangiaceae bacterium]|nr:helix-turn-helix domain-containing protein [Streptosporangiaceae bacterium]